VSASPEEVSVIILDKVGEVARQLEDGLQLSDLAYCIRTAVECAELLDEHSGPAKREIAIQFVKEVLRATDGPGPDILIDPIIEAVAPALIDLVVDATKGKLRVNE
jgi:chromosomal replication initiation ATPase DnaA